MSIITKILVLFHNCSCGVQDTQTRSRSCVPPQNGGHSCDHENIPQSQTESRSCAVFTCGQWGAWSLSCGGAATRTRSRTCSTNAGDGPCPDEGENPDLYADEISEPEDKDACWTEFGDWGDCSVSCGGTGTQTRSKSCIEPTDGGLACPDENVEEVLCSPVLVTSRLQCSFEQVRSPYAFECTP